MIPFISSYDTCNSDKELCDLDFKRCLYKYCDAYEKSVAGGVMVKGCKTAAKMLFTGTLTFGCKSYLDSQARACYCPPGKNDFSKDKRKEKDNKPNKKPNNYGWKTGNDLQYDRESFKYYVNNFLSNNPKLFEVLYDQSVI